MARIMATTTTTKFGAQTPERSLDQRMEALRRANEIRSSRAQLKRDLKNGTVAIGSIIADAPRLRADGQGL